jgi:hypothetical protein
MENRLHDLRGLLREGRGRIAAAGVVVVPDRQQGTGGGQAAEAG